MATLMIHKNVLRQFHKLPSKVQKRVADLVERFQADPYDPAIGLHKLKGTMLDAKVRGADLPGGYRAIVIAPEQGDTFLLVHIDAHDKAYGWAKNKRFEAHGVTGTFQIYDVDEIAEVAKTTDAEAAPDYPLQKLSEEDLFHAGVPRPLIPAVRAIKNDRGLETLGDYLPPDCRDVLVGVAAGLALDQALEEMLGVEAVAVAAAVAPSGPGDFSRLADAPVTDLVFVEGEDELKEVLASSLDEWRIFLHPYQRKLVQWNTNGPMSITGAAGTGKTVVLMHRAAHLARQLTNPRDQVLLTTFTTNLSITIKSHIRRLAPDVADRIEVTNLHQLARTICMRSGWTGRIASGQDREDLWEDVWSDPEIGELPLSKDELKQEYIHVIDANGISTEEEYLTTVRSGRPRVSRKQRRAAWPVFRAFQRGLRKRNILTFEGAIHEARLAVKQGNFQQYAHVLVDEAQDFSLEALRLIAALSHIGDEQVNPLCLAGDGHQRIYRRRIPMSRAGIRVVGRSRRLKINYRTSEQIRQYAQTILKGMEIDDLDEGLTTTIGDHSVFRGPEPVIHRCKDESEEAGCLVAWVKRLISDYGLATHEICITPYKPLIRTQLTGADLTTFELKPREEDPGEEEPGIRLGTMKRIKGLEFRAVGMACSHAQDPMNHLAESEPLERCERYVAATRAREHLMITVQDSGDRD